ncbi:rod shape-determining protein RodA [Trebonia kvetii]|uniref:peptidoglycan glycosyltransferase n=1 Tax=Trebonia kvetii TaxID=2480626 RepID=A0A6P2BUP5_9ACTN|nr:rod shape-determining protein RodA [Trebonia kvetii]TVZ02822.1 rod shape-determining protein RodA [Trebonia kvetii]
MSVGLPSRGWAGPRAGTFAPHRRSPLNRAFAKGGVARSWDWLLIVATCALTAIGTVLIWAATEPFLRQAGLDPHTYLKKTIVWAVLGLLLMFVTALIDYRVIKRLAPYLYVLSLLLLAAVLVVGQSVNGAKAWIALPGGFQVEPSEFAKLGLVLSTAWLLSRRKLPAGRPTIRDVCYSFLAAAPLIALVEKEPALGVTFVLVFTLIGMIVVSGIRMYWVLGGLAVVAAGIYEVAHRHLLKGYQLTRLTSFLHPEQNLAGSGYNGLQAKIAVGSGGMHGQGLFHGTFTGGSFVPSVQTDFIFTVAGEELGFVGCAVIVALLAVIVFRAIRAAQIAEDMFGMLVASGVAIWFGFQAFVNIGMTIGIMPITGLPLPFVSYGGSAIFADMIAIGLIQGVRRQHSIFGDTTLRTDRKTR